MKSKILIICTGNSCRSQMAEGYLKSLDPELAVYSAGTYPEANVNPNAVKVMSEIGIDISRQYPKNVDGFKNESFDFVITVCDSAKESCPVFTGQVKNRLHIGFEDPADAKGTMEEVLSVYRKVRDEIKTGFKKFYDSI
jgi:arsenate reductase